MARRKRLRKNARGREGSSSGNDNTSFLQQLEEQRKRHAAMELHEEAKVEEEEQKSNTSAARELRGFVYDAQKKRYFPKSSVLKKEHEKNLTDVQVDKRKKWNMITQFLPLRESGHRRSYQHSSILSKLHMRQSIAIITHRIQKMNQVQRPYTDAQTPISFLSMHPSQEQLAVKGGERIDVYSMLANDDTLGGARCIPHVMSYRHVDSEITSFQWIPHQDSHILAWTPLHSHINAVVRFGNVNRWILAKKNAWSFRNDPVRRERCCIGGEALSDTLKSPVAYGNIEYSSRFLTFCTFPASTNCVVAQDYLPTGNSSIVNGTRNGSFWIWDTRMPSSSLLFHDEQHINRHKIVALRALVNDTTKVLISFSDGMLALYDIRQGRDQKSVTSVLDYAGNSSNHRSISMLVDAKERFVTIANTDQHLRIWDIHSGLCLRNQFIGYNFPCDMALRNDPDDDSSFEFWLGNQDGLWNMASDTSYR